MADENQSVAEASAPPERQSAAFETARPAQSNLWLFALLISVTALNSVAINLLVPSLPRLADEFGVDYGAAQLTTSVFLIANAVGFLSLGAVSDRIGRRPALICGLSLFTVASAICAAAGSMQVLLVARTIEGVGASSGVVLGQSIIRDRYDHRRSASVIAYMALGYGAAPMVAPLIGGAVGDHLGWRANFVLLALAGLAATLAAYRGLAETARRTEGRGALADLKTLAGERGFWAFTLTYTCSFAIFYCFLAGTSYAARFILNIDGTAYGVYFIVVNLGYSLAAYLTGRFVGRVGPTTMMAAGAAVALAATIGMTIAFLLGHETALDYFLPMLIINFGNGLMQSNAIASVASVRPELAGTATGLAGALQVLFSAAAAMIVGATLSLTRSPAGFGLASAVFACGALSASLWARTIRVAGILDAVEQR